MSERASERWLRELAVSGASLDDLREAADGRAGQVAVRRMDAQRAQYASEIARIDAAEARFEACSETARESAQAVIGFRSWVTDWEKAPVVYEALADVACGIDRRAQGECPICSRMTKPICDTAKEASDAST